MVKEAGFVFSTQFYTLLIIVIIVIIIAVILAVIESRLKKKVINLTEKRRNPYLFALKKLSKSSEPPANKLKHLNEISKSFFREHLNLSDSHSFSELSDILRKKGEKEPAVFCESMINAYYSEENLTPEKVRALTHLLYNIIFRHHAKENPSFHSRKIQERNSLLKKDIIRKSIWKSELSKVNENKHEIRKILDSLLLNMEIEALSKIEVKSSHESIKLLHENTNALSELKKASLILKKSHDFLNKILGKLHNSGNPAQKTSLEEIHKKIQKEQEMITEKIKNPFKQRIIHLELLEKYLTNLSILIVKS